MNENLYKKLAAIKKKLGDVPKTGFNSFQNYPYHTESDVLGALKPLLDEYGVDVIPSLDWDHSDKMPPIFHDGDITTVLTKYTIVDSETGENIVCYWAGQGQDKSDKGANKAFTSAGKYFLIKLFRIATDEDADKEGIPSAPARTAPVQQQPTYNVRGQVSSPPPTTPSPSGHVCKKCGKSVPQGVANFSINKFGDIYCMDCQKIVAKG